MNNISDAKNPQSEQAATEPTLDGPLAIPDQAKILDAWLNDEDLPEGTLGRELPWLRDLFWELTIQAPRGSQESEAETSPQQSWRSLAGGTLPCYRQALQKQSSILSFQDDDDNPGVPDPLPVGEFWGVTISGNAVAIDCPLQNPRGIDFPGHVALVEWEGPGGTEIERALLKVEKSDNRYQARSTLEELFPEISPSELRSGTLWILPVAFWQEVLCLVHPGQLQRLRQADPGDDGLKRLEHELDRINQASTEESRE